MYSMHMVNFVLVDALPVQIFGFKLNHVFLLYKLTERFYSSQTDTTCCTQHILMKISN